MLRYFNLNLRKWVSIANLRGLAIIKAWQHFDNRKSENTPKTSCFFPKNFVYFNKYLLFNAYHGEVLVVDIINHVYSAIELSHAE